MCKFKFTTVNESVRIIRYFKYHELGAKELLTFDPRVDIESTFNLHVSSRKLGQENQLSKHMVSIVFSKTLFATTASECKN